MLRAKNNGSVGSTFDQILSSKFQNYFDFENGRELGNRAIADHFYGGLDDQYCDEMDF